MSDAPIHLLAFRDDDEFEPCVDYVLRLFARTSGFVLHVNDFQQPPPEAFLAAPRRLALVYEAPETLPEGFLERIHDAAPRVAVVRRGNFFGDTFLKSPDLPESAESLLAAAAPDGLSRRADHLSDNAISISLDVIASAFWFLSRYEETIVSTVDEHGRFQCSASMAPPAMYDLPVVNRWFEQLRALLLQPLGWLEAKPGPWDGPQQTMVLTHDVDLLKKYRGVRGVSRALSSIVQAGVSEGTNEVRYASLVMAGLRRDPYDSFDDMFTLKERIGAVSTWFLFGGGNHSMDADYKLGDPEIRNIVLRAKAAGDEIAVHPSYETWRNQPAIAGEIGAVSAAAGRMVQGGRQHYLRVAVPGTLNLLAASGLRYDASLGFADRAGFRCGWSGCFHPFDVELRQEIPIIEIPLVCMDVTLASYEKIPGERSLERMSSLLDASEARGGAFTFLWHNTMKDRRAYPGYWETFEYFFLACAGSARYVTMQTLCDEFDAQGQALGVASPAARDRTGA